MLPSSEPYQSLFCVQYIKGAYAVMIVSKKNFKLAPSDCKGNEIQISQGRKMGRKEGRVCVRVCAHTHFVYNEQKQTKNNNICCHHL